MRLSVARLTVEPCAPAPICSAGWPRSRSSRTSSRPVTSPRPSTTSSAGGGEGRRPARPTGTGKSATTAWMIEKLQRPTLVMAPNKTLAAQLANEFRELLPNNAVEPTKGQIDDLLHEIGKRSAKHERVLVTMLSSPACRGPSARTDRRRHRHPDLGPAHQPRSRHSWRCVRSVPNVVLAPCPGYTRAESGNSDRTHAVLRSTVSDVQTAQNLRGTACCSFSWPQPAHGNDRRAP